LIAVLSAKEWTVGAVLAGTILLIAIDGLTLFLPAPPVMARHARYLAIILVSGLCFTILAAVAGAIRQLPKAWSRQAKWAAVILLVGCAGAVLSYISSVAFSLVHFACYEATLCASEGLGTQALYTITVATRDAPFESLLVLAAVVAIALRSRRG
jgi:hypothetical protein